MWIESTGMGNVVRACLAIAGLACAMGAQSTTPSLGLFEASTDVGTVRVAGASHYDTQSATYRLSGAGENMWLATDAFHFVWKKLSGDFRLAADIAFEGEGKNPHRKAVLMLRQSLDADAAYVDIAIHGDGLTSMQFRGGKGASTQELQFGKPAPGRAELVRQGNRIFVRLDGVEMRLGERSVRMENFLRGEVYAGIGVCSHEIGLAETALFRNVILENAPPTSR
ncbi:MAG: hypothetical protein U5J83_16925 [Bryobacterales bacterium]|nr:hypothetical protein [Bryobacterales bacterium]